MKRAIAYTLLAAFLMVGAAGPSTTSADDQAREKWPKLPELRFQNCISATQSIKNNPFSATANDFFLVTSYEENQNAESDHGQRPAAPSALNVYLVMGVFMAHDKAEGRVHGMALIVEERNSDVTRRSEPSFRRWVLLDENGDGRLDKAMFGENPGQKVTIAADGKEVQQMASEKLPSLQGYFDSAVRDLSNKAAAGSIGTCYFV
ncbi:MAG: hypothetical protein WAL90_12780 [Desulfobacterales bacterium]